MNTVKTLLHTFIMSDCEDPELYAADPIYKWQQTEMGQWCMEHADDPSYRITPDMSTYGYRVLIEGSLTEHEYTYFALKWKTNGTSF